MELLLDMVLLFFDSIGCVGYQFVELIFAVIKFIFIFIFALYIVRLVKRDMKRKLRRIVR